MTSDSNNNLNGAPSGAKTSTSATEEAWERGIPAKKSLIFDNVVHYPKESILTTLSANLKLDGFKNFVFLILLISCGRLMFENVSLYGFAHNPVRFLSYTIEYGANRLTLIYLGVLFLFTMVSLILEKSYIAFLTGNQRVARHPNGTSTFLVTPRMERNFQMLTSLLLLLVLLFPVLFNRLVPTNPYLMVVVCMLYATTFLKLFSYHQTNSWWRTGLMYGKPLEEMRNIKKLEEKMEEYMEDLKTGNGDGANSVVFYPENLSISDMLYYSLVPTLCYQVNFPRKRTINYAFVLRCLLEAIFLLELQIVLAQQWIYTPLNSQQVPPSQMSVQKFILVWTKMSLATISIWLIGFYALFQSQANLLAELTYFADRDFYRDWWNAQSVSEFWRNWNIPVHRWCVRHLYKPLLIQGGVSSTTASTLVFFVSGLLHEYFISPPLGLFGFHFILGMTLQQPLDMLTANLHKSSARLANSVVWLSLILGQSMLLLQYYNDILVGLGADAAQTTASPMI